ncbi:MAG: ferritin-like domain-containing protein [Deltaproteobacteria bacterium]|nr:ferritin-like domain-containing protein [Deltaproteobacteria bacterium]
MPVDLDDNVEDAVVQVMSYLVENETAALLVPARFCAETHPHFREMMQCLAIQCADEARHIEVFTRRLRLAGRSPGLSTAGGQASLKTLVDEPDFALASFMLSVLGEGGFLALLRFLDHYGPDAITRQVCRLAAGDEARHVALGVAHLELSARQLGPPGAGLGRGGGAEAGDGPGAAGATAADRLQRGRGRATVGVAHPELHVVT